MAERTDKTDERGLISMTGTVESVIYSNEENGYAICDLGTEDDEIVTIVGTLPYIGEGDHVTVFGRWVHNPKYGRQFRVEQYEKKLPADTASILRYLSSRTVRGIGPKTAQKIVDAFGTDTFDVIENHPDWLEQVGISGKKAQAISEDFREKSGIRSAMMFFRDYFGAALTVRIYRKWGSGAVEIARNCPYRLCEEIEGIGFEKADAMADKLGLSRDSEERAMSGLLYLLNSNAAQNGHVCLPREKLIAAGAKMLTISEESAADAVKKLLAAGKLKVSVFGGESYIYTAAAYDSECYIAEKLELIDKLCVRPDVEDVYGFIRREEAGSGMEYAELQRKAIYDALSNGVLILSGGPGTGKTTVVRALLHIFRSLDFKVALTAPTGRAAKRLSESTSWEAKTIHRLLEMEYDGNAPESSGFRRDSHNYLEEDVIIVDEASMVDNALMSALLKAIKPGARLIIIGDADQLPSVGAGNVLRDLISSGHFATILLTEIFRQAEKSLIVTNAHAINEGRMPRLDVKDRDFFYLPRGSDREIAMTVADLCRNRLPHAYGGIAETGTQVITPSRKGEAGTENLNLLLQSCLNPPAKSKREFVHRDRVFREGDRVMQIRNNYDLSWTRGVRDEGTGVFNGDIGTVMTVDPVEKRMEICFDERTVFYDFSLAEDLEHAWAITVHKSQGSEYPIVIIPLYQAPPLLLTRNLFYTAVTRAERMVILVGREEVVRTMVENNRQSMRYTGLAYRLSGTEGKA